mmetsp:Transcript_11909/g.35843  ORF Transcript_11909/g.35843 Transcript_11909/m.35843 type:complete len:283 (-) Transcript_11909:38-886(-)
MRLALCVSSASALYAGVRRPPPALARYAAATMASWAEASAATDDATESIKANLASVTARVAAAAEKKGSTPALIAVSKLKPLNAVAAAHAAGHRDFGENYVQELAEKGAASADVEGLRWHFIGSLQSNKVRQLCGVPNLACVHTVERAKIANALDRVWGELRPDAAPLAVFVQVNTSGEDSKGGCAPADAPALCETVQACERLTLTGLMCIGKYSGAEGDASPDFKVLAGCRDAAAAKLGVDVSTLGLSMGMSHDFEQAIDYDATHVRVGSTIFGARPPKGA